MNLTNQQSELVHKFDKFLAGPNRCFILKGYAGTGKTFLIGEIAQRLMASHLAFILLAPTGRAARVLCRKTGFPASTIHRAIYNFEGLVEQSTPKGAFKFYYRLKDTATDNLNVVVIVDEASMLSDFCSESEFITFGSGRLLYDLIHFYRLTDSTQKSRILFVGDPAQLPPVNMPISPALDCSYLEEQYRITVEQTELTDIVRQSSDSPILREAAKIRSTLASRIYNQLHIEPAPPTITSLKMAELPVKFIDANHEAPVPHAICIAYSNATCLNLNIAIRANRFGGDGMHRPVKSDVLLVIRNNAATGLLNGDLVYVLDSASHQHVANVPVGSDHVRLTFRDIRILKDADDGGSAECDVKILENVLHSEKRDLSPNEQKALYIHFKIRNPHLRPNTKEFTQALYDDTFFNALQVKYGYAMTCHKAQGGEWDTVFIIFENNRTDAQALRWTYTALTRARTRLSGINLPKIQPWSRISANSSINSISPHQQELEQDFSDFENTVSEVPNQWDDQFPVEPRFLKAYHRRIVSYFTQRGIAIDTLEVRVNNYYWRYSISRAMKRLHVQIYYNSKGVLRPQILSSATFDPDFADELIQMLKAVVNGPSPVETWSIDFPLDKPYLREFYTNYIEPRIVTHSCRVTKIEHFQFRERYHISSNDSNTVLDAIYNSKGLFSSISWSSGDHNLSDVLLSDE